MKGDAMKPIKTWEKRMDSMVCEQFAVANVALRNQIRWAWRSRHNPWFREWLRECVIILRRNIAVRRAFVDGQIQCG